MKRQACLILALLLLGTMLTGCQISERVGHYVWERLYAPEQTTPGEAGTESAADPERAEKPGAYIPGVKTDTGYENESLGLQFTISRGMAAFTGETLDEIMGQSWNMMVDNGSMGREAADFADSRMSYEYCAFNLLNNSGVIVMVERFPIKGISEELYINSIRENTERDSTDPKLDDPEVLELCGTEFWSLKYHAIDEGAEFDELLLVKKVEDLKFLQIGLIYTSQEDLDTLLACFSPLE